jgi:hypothetical protein
MIVQALDLVNGSTEDGFDVLNSRIRRKTANKREYANKHSRTQELENSLVAAAPQLSDYVYVWLLLPDSEFMSFRLRRLRIHA